MRNTRKSRYSLFFLILIVTTSGILLAAADFGESSESLGQITDEFDTLDNVSVSVFIERNATLNAMELNFTAGGQKEFINLSSFIEVDPGADMTVTNLRNSWFQMPRNVNNYLYKDFGIDFFDNWYVEATINMSDVEAGDATNAGVTGFVSVSNTVGNVINLRTDDVIMVYAIQNGANDDRFAFTNIEYSGGVFKGGVTGAPRDVGMYYVIWNRTGANVFFGVYSDAGHTVLLEDLSFVSTGGDDYRYIQAGMSFGGATDPNDHSTGYIEELWNGTVSGYFTTTDYLEKVEGSVLVQMTSTTIPADTGITIEFSQDNSTWINSTSLTEGFQSIDLRTLNWSDSYYLRFNLTGFNIEGQSSITPTLYQSRLITTEGAVITGPSVNVSGIWINYQAVSIINLTGVHTVGDLNSTFFIDGDTWNHTEVAGPPGHLIQVNFSGVDPDAECLWVTIFYLYTGNVQHDFDIEMWNFTSSSWVDDGHLVDGVAFEWANSTIYAMRIPLDFLSGGQVRVQLNHEPPGNVNHELSIDYIRLVAKIPGEPLIVEGGAVAIFPWIAIAIILSLITYLLARER